DPAVGRLPACRPVALAELDAEGASERRRQAEARALALHPDGRLAGGGARLELDRRDAVRRQRLVLVLEAGAGLPPARLTRAQAARGRRRLELQGWGGPHFVDTEPVGGRAQR